MPLGGAKPKPDGQKVTRHPLRHEWTDVPDVPFEGAPRLPAKQPDGSPWPAWTRRWWRAVSSMPHCVLWTETDWQFAFGTAVVVAQFHGGEVRLATELRNREKLLGMTMDARRDLRIRYIDPAAVADESRSASESTHDGGASVTRMDEYRDVLG